MQYVTVHRCQECDHVSQETAGAPLYECSSCGHKFNKNNGEGKGNRCTECGKFGSKLADDSCVECEEGELEDETGVSCDFCDEVFPEDDIEDHLKQEHVEDVVSYYMSNESIQPEAKPVAAAPAGKRKRH